jgi:hypothetical protein
VPEGIVTVSVVPLPAVLVAGRETTIPSPTLFELANPKVDFELVRAPKLGLMLEIGVPPSIDVFDSAQATKSAFPAAG